MLSVRQNDTYPARLPSIAWCDSTAALKVSLQPSLRNDLSVICMILKHELWVPLEYRTYKSPCQSNMISLAPTYDHIVHPVQIWCTCLFHCAPGVTIEVTIQTWSLYLVTVHCKQIVNKGEIRLTASKWFTMFAIEVSKICAFLLLQTSPFVLVYH